MQSTAERDLWTSRARASSCQAVGTTWFSRVAAAFSSYDGDLSLPLGLALGSSIFLSGCEGKLGVALESLQGETPWTIAHQAPLFVEFSRQEYWSGVPFPSPGDLPNPGIEPRSPHCKQILSHLSLQPRFPLQLEGKIELPRANPRGRLRSPS